MASDGSPPSKKRNFSKGNVWFIDDSSEESDPEQYAQAIHYDYTAAITSSSEDDWDSDEEEEQEAGDGEGSPEENKENKAEVEAKAEEEDKACEKLDENKACENLDEACEKAELNKERMSQ